jgi:hypothetical protein
MALRLADSPDVVKDSKKADRSVRVGTAPLSVYIYNKFEELPESYGAIFEEAGQKSVFLTLPWFRHFAQTALDTGDEVRIYGICGAHCASAPTGLFVARKVGRKSRVISLRKLVALANYYSPFFAPHLASTGVSDAEKLETLGDAIAQESPRWDAIEIKPLDVNAPYFSGFVQAFKAHGFVVQTFFHAGNWYEPINGRSFREYFEGLRSPVRNIAKSKNKKIERSGRVRCEILEGTEGLERGIAAYNQVYAASWKVQEPYPEFVPKLIRTCAEEGTLRLGLAYVDGEPAAAQIWIVHAGIASIYKIAYDQKFRDLSVGTYLMTRMMELAIDVEKVAEIDYLTGDDRYKMDWMSQRRERWGILALNPCTFRGALAIARHVGGRAAKRTILALAARLRRKDSLANRTRIAQ